MPGILGGVVAAAGLYALEHHIVRLKEDHEKAAELASTLKKQSYVKAIEPVETNIVIFYLQDAIKQDQFLNFLETNYIKISAMGEGKLRMVTHLDYTNSQHEQCLNVLNAFTV